MHLRTVTVKKKAKSYRYAQIVQGYRRKSDGMPSQRVVLKLGRLSDQQIRTWRTALQALRQGRPLIIPDDFDDEANIVSPCANLDFLDVTLLLELWNRWGLSSLFDSLMPAGEATIAPSAIVCALTIQRCVAPTPKGSSPRWLRKTALPELLGIATGQFNNTRLHRVLDELDEAGPELMRRLPVLYSKREGKFVALFLDVTDSWFVGRGPDCATKGTTKEGRFERKINIVLLCNEKGYPLRWEVVPGSRHDSKTMLDIFEAIAKLEWASAVPVVCDRAMGNTAHLRNLTATGAHFLTALVRSEFPSYTDALPYRALLEFEPGTGQRQRKEAIAQAGVLAEKAGMQKVDDTLYLLDLGIVTYLADRPRDATADEPADGSDPAKLDRTVVAMQLGRRIRALIEEGRASGYRSAGSSLGLTRRQSQNRYSLTTLPEDVQEAIVRGEASGLTLGDLMRIVKLGDADQQRSELARRVAALEPHQKAERRRRGRRPNLRHDSPDEPLRVRAVGYFNPEIFVQKRLNAREVLKDIEDFVKNLNTTLAKPQSHRTTASIHSALDRKLRKLGLLDAFGIDIRAVTIGNSERYQVHLELKDKEWRRRRRYDGFSLLVGHPDIDGTAEKLCRLYREKDMVEKDFRIIKSIIELRPFHHRLDAKIRAHVTLCMLGLLLERTLKERLRAGGLELSPQAALDTLQTCRLNCYASVVDRAPAYKLTRITEPQHKILRALRLQKLVANEEVLGRLTPR